MNPLIKNRLTSINTGFLNESLIYEHKVLPNEGYLLIDVPEALIHILNQEKNKIQSNFSNGVKFNNNLAGQIEKEYKLNDSLTSLENFVNIAAKKYSEIHDWPSRDNFQLDGAWINFQKKYEFNPNHVHTGNLSFVIWLDIPYSIEDEANLDLTKDSNNLSVGCFEFVYTTTLGQIKHHTLEIDKKYNGKMIIFSSKMMHSVYPFYTSDNYRISVSGNIT